VGTHQLVYGGPGGVLIPCSFFGTTSQHQVSASRFFTQKLDALSFTHKKEFIVWYSGAKMEDTRARRVEKMKQMLSVGKVIS
jgi:uncharacterized protein YdeI (YjbR/CyaY-like superfamily)